MVKTLGMLAIIDEETRTPAATDEGLVRRFCRDFNNNGHFVRTSQGDNHTFAIAHFAGKVSQYKGQPKYNEFIG